MGKAYGGGATAIVAREIQDNIVGGKFKVFKEETRVLNFNFLNCVIFILFIIINLLNGKK